MQTQIKTSRKIGLELKDMLSGAAFPVMLMLIFSASVISFSSATTELALQIVILVIGEIFLAAAYFIFGRQSGIVAYRKTVQQGKKRDLGTGDIRALCYTGEYAPYKGFAIGFISCIPYIVVQIIGSAVPNTVCDFLLVYAFGWAAVPFSLAGLSTWLNLVWVVPLVGIHAGAYLWGAKREESRQNAIAAAQENAGKKRKSK